MTAFIQNLRFSLVNELILKPRPGAGEELASAWHSAPPPAMSRHLCCVTGLATTIGGLVIGLGLSFVAVQGIGSLLFDGGGFDLPIVAAAFVALATSALAANLIPARRATRVAATIALRN